MPALQPAAAARSQLADAAEVSFCAMAGARLAASKTSWNGMHERLDLLNCHGVVLPTLIGGAGEAAPADLIDAVAVAWTATRIAASEASSLPASPQVVEGRRIAIWY
jgi:predicted RNase H-like nuclease